MSTPDVHLAWPPPGLEAMRGRALQLARRLGVADALVLGALIGFSSGDQPAGSPFTGPALACLALAMIGSLMLISAALGVWRVAREGGSNVWRGYTWLTISEVIADPRGNTGALIRGSGEFAELTADTRNGLRIARLVSGFARLAAGLIPLPAFFLLGMIGGNGGPGTGILLSFGIAVLPSLVLLAFASVAGSAERAALRPLREKELKRFDRRTDAIKLSDEWYTSFEDARQGQSLGRGPAGGVMRAWAVGGAASVVIIVGVMALLPVWILAAAGSAGSFGRTPIFSNNIQKVQQYAYLRSFTPVVDSTITPERAGDAFHAIALRDARGVRAAYIKPPTHTFPAFPMSGPRLFPGMRGTGAVWPGTPVLALAKKGLTPEQRAYASAVATNPIWEQFGVVARSRRVDIAAGEFILPFPPDVSALSIGGTRFTSMRDLAYASVVRAASYLADGHPADAERALREEIAFGFRMIDDGNTSFDPLIGIVLVEAGQDALVNLYQLTDNPNGARLRDLSNGANRRPDTFSWSAEYLIANRDAPRGVRLAAMQARAMTTCASVHGLLFGPTVRELRLLNSMRSQIARSPAEEAVFDLDANTLARPLPTRSGMTFVGSLFVASAQVSGALFHSPRIPNCAKSMPWGQRPIF